MMDLTAIEKICDFISTAKNSNTLWLSLLLKHVLKLKEARKDNGYTQPLEPSLFQKVFLWPKIIQL